MQDGGFRERLGTLIGDKEPFVWAKEIGIPSGTFARFWNEGAIPKAEHLVRISRACRVSVDWLLTGQDPFAGPSQPIDEALLLDVIEAVEEHLVEYKMELTTTKKALLVTNLYMMMVEQGEKTSTQGVLISRFIWVAL